MVLVSFPILLVAATLPVPCSPFSFPASTRPPSPRNRSRRNDGGINPSHLVGAKQSCHRPRPLQPSPPPDPLRLMASRPGATSSRDDIGNVLQKTIDQFISTIQQSVDDGSFESFTLKGPSAPRKRRKHKPSSNSADADAMLEQQKERLRGKFKQISGRLVLLQEKKKKKKAPDDESGDAGTLHVQATIKYHLATDVAKNWKVHSRPNSEQTEVENGLREIFSTAAGDNNYDVDRGAPLSEWGAQNINNGELGILTGELVTSTGVHKLELRPQHKASFRISKKKSSQKDANAPGRDTALSHLSHDRSKRHPLPPSSEFFQRLGVSNADGKPVIGMASKLRQCQKFVEIVGNLVESSPPSRIRVIDMGCGRGYLTFSLHSYLCNKFGGMQEVSVETQGIDRRPKLIEEINGIAEGLGGEFSTLNFIEGNIGETHGCLFGDDNLHKNTGNSKSLDILIALHACDTATDDALWFAIGRDADVIVTAPCCQHELRPQIDRHAANNPDHPLSDILSHAIYRERSTEVVTDATRAILLEIAGYNVQVFEFIGGEHTAKNVMITATKLKRQQSDEEKDALRRRLIELAQFHGVQRQRLAALMGESIVTKGVNESKAVRRNLSGMAPLDL